MLRMSFGSHAIPVALTALVLSLSTTHTADARPVDEPRMMLELQGGPYVPDVDAAFDGATPWRDSFNGNSMTLLRGEFDYQFLRGFGSLAIGFGAGYGWVDGQALNGAGEATADEIGFNIAPFALSLVYRWDWAAVKHGVPLVPFVKVGLDAHVWWATDAKGNIAKSSAGGATTRRGTGVTFGWHASAGLMLLLDIFSRGMAASLEDETGVQNSYLFAEFSYNNINDFGSSTSIDLSASAFSFGLAFEF